ncbi:hypothetical protein ACFVRB_27665 [Streptomyces nojiriensis]|uniref:hypothetical protein n=1 Tax=Streptomyces nojiriensis TaxID=66374 RepID=UPI0036DC137B
MVDSVGRPEIIDAPRPVPGAGPLVPFPAETGTVLDLAPTERGLLLLAADGRILLWDVEAGSCTHLATTGVTVPADAKPWSGHGKALRLHASRNGRFAAVVVDFGRTGEVIDLTTGTVTTVLENDGYHSETVHYSLLFTEHAGRDVVLHRTRWNRIAGTDPATGEPVLQMPESGKEAAWAHSFHGALHLSPGGGVDGRSWGLAQLLWCGHGECRGQVAAGFSCMIYAPAKGGDYEQVAGVVGTDLG